MKTFEKIKTKISSPKVQLAMGLAVVSLGWLAPDNSSSYCEDGTGGDCEITTDGNSTCIKGDAFNDCK